MHLARLTSSLCHSEGLCKHIVLEDPKVRTVDYWFICPVIIKHLLVARIWL